MGYKQKPIFKIAGTLGRGRDGYLSSFRNLILSRAPRINVLAHFGHCGFFKILMTPPPPSISTGTKKRKQERITFILLELIARVITRGEWNERMSILFYSMGSTGNKGVGGIESLLFGSLMI